MQCSMWLSVFFLKNNHWVYWHLVVLPARSLSVLCRSRLLKTHLLKNTSVSGVVVAIAGRAVRRRCEKTGDDNRPDWPW